MVKVIDEEKSVGADAPGAVRTMPTVADRLVLKMVLAWPEYHPSIGDGVPPPRGTVENHHPECEPLRAVIREDLGMVEFYYVFAGQESYVHESGQWAIHLCDGGEFDPDDLARVIDAVGPRTDLDEEVCETAVRCALDLLRLLSRSAKPA